jgi:hypothetical protein
MISIKGGLTSGWIREGKEKEVWGASYAVG